MGQLATDRIVVRGLLEGVLVDQRHTRCFGSLGLLLEVGLGHLSVDFGK